MTTRSLVVTVLTVWLLLSMCASFRATARATVIPPSAVSPEVRRRAPVIPAPHHRPDPFLPLHSIGAGTSVFIPAAVLDYGLPPARPGPDRVPTADWPRVAAMAWDYSGKAYAVLETGGRCFIVEPGDWLAAGVRVVAIDRMRAVVILQEDGTGIELPLMPGAETPARP